jgi:hypothetical protein
MKRMISKSLICGRQAIAAAINELINFGGLLDGAALVRRPHIAVDRACI